MFETWGLAWLYRWTWKLVIREKGRSDKKQLFFPLQRLRWSLLVFTNRGFGGLHDNLMVDLHWLVRVFETFPRISIWDIELQDAILNAGVGYIWPPEYCNNMHIIIIYIYIYIHTMTTSTTRIEIKFVKPLLKFENILPDSTYSYIFITVAVYGYALQTFQSWGPSGKWKLQLHSHCMLPAWCAL